MRPLSLIWSTNPLEWRPEEVARRTFDVTIFPKSAVLLRMVRMLLAKQHEDTAEANQNQAAGKPNITR